MSESPLLEIEDLRISFGTRTSDVRAVDGVDLEIRPGEVLGLVGESGSGKERHRALDHAAGADAPRQARLRAGFSSTAWI